MTTLALHATPRWRTVAGEQLRMVALLLRGGGLLLLALLIALVALAAVQVASSLSAPAIHRVAITNFTFTPEVSVTVAFLALIIPLMVWRDEDPLQRGYHWLMPVSRRAHALARAFAGWVWTMVATFAFVLSIVLLTVIVERISGQPQPYHPGFRAWEWLVPFTSASICYLFASAAAIGARRPLVWIFGVIAIYAGSILLLVQRGMPEQARALMIVWAGYIGARAATFGVIPSADGSVLQDPLRWSAATIVWGGAALVLVWLMASRYREGS